jgi:hypothetical protein
LQQTTIQSVYDPPIFGYFHDSAIECMNASNIQYQPPITLSHVLIGLPLQLLLFLEFAISSRLSSRIRLWSIERNRTPDLYFTISHAQSKISLGTSKTGLVGRNFSQRHVFDQNTFLAIKLRYTTESSFRPKEVVCHTAAQPVLFERRGWRNRSPQNFLESRQQSFFTMDKEHWRVASSAVESGQVYERGVKA